MSSCVCKISFKSVQVCGGCCKMFRGITFLGHSVCRFRNHGIVATRHSHAASPADMVVGVRKPIPVGLYVVSNTRAVLVLLDAAALLQLSELRLRRCEWLTHRVRRVHGARAREVQIIALCRRGLNIAVSQSIRYCAIIVCYCIK